MSIRDRVTALREKADAAVPQLRALLMKQGFYVKMRGIQATLVLHSDEAAIAPMLTEAENIYQQALEISGVGSEPGNIDVGS